jgi:hypothetical protein
MRRRFFFIPLIGITFAALASAVVMLLWNAILPPLLNVGTISYWQALGLLILSRILFGGFHHGWHDHHRPHFTRERWMRLSDDERERIRQRWHSRCGWHEPTPNDPAQTT